MHSVPYSARITLKPMPASGSTVQVQAKVYMVLPGDKSRTKSMTVAAKIC